MQSFATHLQPIAPRPSGRLASLLGLALVIAGVGLPRPAAAQSVPPVLEIPATWTDIQNIPGISGVTTTNCSGIDDCLTSTINLPFTFTFFGQARSALKVSTNCWMTFDTSLSSSDLSNDDIPDTSDPNDIIAFAWDDCRSEGMRYGVFGSAPSRVFVIESVYRYWSGGSASNNTRNQIWLYEDGSTIDLRYDGTSHVNSHSASIGIENATGTAGWKYPCTPSCSASDLGALSGRRLRIGEVPNPELRADVIDFPRGGFPGTTGTGTVTVENLSTATATSVVVDVWLSVDDTLDTTVDVRVGTATVASPSGLTAATVEYTVPSGIAVGDYFLISRVDATDRYTELAEDDNVGVADRRFATAYELSGTGCRVTNPRGVNPGETLTFEVDVVNSGVSYVGPLQVELRASTNNVFDGTDPVLDTVLLSLTGAATETVQGAFTLAAGALTPGQYFPICTLDPVASGAPPGGLVPEIVETNNIVVGGTRFGSGPDFTVSEVVVPGQVQPGNAVNVATTIDNAAVPFSGVVDYQLYASVDDTLDAGTDFLLGSFSATFAGEDTITDVESVTFSTSVPGGRYRVIAVVDPTPPGIPEVDETNNAGASATTIANAIDFEALSATVEVTPPVLAGDPVRVTGSAASTGLSFTGNVPFGVYFSSNDTFDATDTQGYRGLIFFAGNDTSASIDVTFSAPSSLPPGAYNILFVINPDDNPAEADRVNNEVRASRAVTVEGADLRVESLIAPDVVFFGRTAEVSITISNESSIAEARGFSYRYYLSENDLIRTTDYAIYTSTVPLTVAPDSTVTYTDQILIPEVDQRGNAYTSTQSLYLGVIVDIFSAVPETNENNNIRRRPIPLDVVFPIPDLEAQIVETATSAAAGEQLAVTRLITNSGVADASSFEFAYYLSENPTISTDDRELGRFTASLPTNSDDYAIDILDIPPDVAAGTYYVGIIMDPDEVVTEVSDLNNTAVGPALPVFGAAIVFVTDALPNGILGVRYETGLYARGGSQPITWSVSEGDLPPGIDLNDGILQGEPTAEGLFEFTLRASSGTAFAEREFSVRITTPTVQLSIATPTLRSAIATRPYSADLVAVGGVPPYRWSSITELPSGIELTEGGRLEGTPETPGQYDLTFRVIDDLGNSATAQFLFNIVSPTRTVQIDQVPLTSPVVGLPYCSEGNPVTFSAQNGVPPYTWSASGSIPPGMTINDMGEFCGTPERAGTYDFTLRAQDSTELFDTALIRVTVRGNDECAIATFVLPEAQLGEPYIDQDGDPVQLLQARCVEPLMDWMLVEGGGTLPPGLSLSAEGAISGTPTEAGNYAFIAMITDATMSSAVQPLSIRVTAPPEEVEPPDDGCTCATPSSARSAPLAWLALLPGLALVARRRRR